MSGELTRRDMAGAMDSGELVTFNDVAVIFSGEEWELLSFQQRALYMDVMKENYEHFIFLGLKVPIILSWLQNTHTAACEDQKSFPEHPRHEANHVQEKKSHGDPSDSYSHPGNGAIKKSSKKVRPSKKAAKRRVNPTTQDENRSGPAFHGRYLRERKQYFCPHCEKCFNYNSALEAHVRVHSGDKPHKCEDCNKSYSYKSELIVHRRKHSKSSTSAAKNVNSAPQVKTEPEESLLFPDTSMNGALGSNNTSDDYPLSPASQPAEDPEASSPSSSSRTPPQHDNDKPLKCNFCEKRFNDRTILEAHHRIHTGKLAYPCSMCDMSFSKPSLLAAHNNTHREGKPFQCDQCDKNFNDHSLLVAHKRTHTGEKPHKCSLCSKWFPNRNSLVDHEECHLKPKPFKCRHCEKSFNDKSLLVTHEGVHTDTKPFKCMLCNESFFLKTQLMAHQVNHAPDKPYPCHQCERSFNKRETLLAHIRVHNMQSLQVQKKKRV